jgi:hypothetical protein
MKIASFIIGFVGGLATLIAGGAVLAAEHMVNKAGSWVSDFVVIDPVSLTPWWFVLFTGVAMVIAASMTFERPMFAMVGFGLAIPGALVATGSGASHAWIAAIPATIALVMLLIPPKDWPVDVSRDAR